MTPCAVCGAGVAHLAPLCFVCLGNVPASIRAELDHLAALPPTAPALGSTWRAALRAAAAHHARELRRRGGRPRGAVA